MSHILTKVSLLLVALLAFASPLQAEDKANILHEPLGKLFDHSKHSSALKQSQISCTECHSFSVKSNMQDPLSPGVPAGHLKASNKSCHLCHLNAVRVATPNQCALCHKDKKLITPESHLINWKLRHGKLSQQDPNSCMQCHQQSTCDQCHTQKNVTKRFVHRPNFRLTHSIEARANPTSCVLCHSNTKPCISCHSGGIKK